MINKKDFILFSLLDNMPIPVFGVNIVSILQKYVEKVGHLDVIKTNMPSKDATIQEHRFVENNYPNIKSCTLENFQPKLVLNYSNKPLSYSGVEKLVLAHKMYGFPYYDESGNYGISNRDNYVIIDKTKEEFLKLKAFLSTKFTISI